MVGAKPDRFLKPVRSKIRKLERLEYMSNTGQILGDIGSTINDNLDCWEVLAK